MIVPDDCLNLLEEIREGSRVCNALIMSHSGDTADIFSDTVRIEKSLENYWGRHGSPAIPLAP